MKKEDLELEIHGKNELNRLCKAELTNIYPYIKEFVGKKIFTQIGSKSAKFKPELLDIQAKPFLNGFQNTNGFFCKNYDNLMLSIKICLSGGSYDDKTYYCQYVEKYIWIGDLNNNSELIKLNELDDLFTSNGLNEFIDINQELIKIDKYKELKAELDQVLSSIKVNHDNLKYL